MPETTHYIRCVRCGHLNPFKTEYLTLCESCGRKLENNFPDWQKLHPGGTVADFKKEICVTESNPEGFTASESPARSFIRRPVFSWMLALLAGFLLGALLWFPDKEEWFLKKELSPDVMTADWIWHRTGYPPLLISLPAKPDARSTEVPSVLKEHASQTESFYYRPSATLYVMVDYYQFKTGVQPDPRPVAHAVLKQMVESDGIRLSSFKESPVMYLSAHGMNLEGAFHQNGKLRQFRFLVYTYRNAAYVVRAVYRNTDPNAAKAAEKIIDSVEIDTEMRVG